MSNHTLYLVRLDSLRKNGKATDRKLAEYILSRPETLQRLTVQQLAELTDTSYATVCRFFRKLGTDGFRDFKRILSSELQQTEGHPMEPPEFNIEADKAVSFSEIQQKICDYSASIVSSCGKFLHPSIIEQTVTHLKKSRPHPFHRSGHLGRNRPIRLHQILPSQAHLRLLLRHHPCQNEGRPNEIRRHPLRHLLLRPHQKRPRNRRPGPPKRCRRHLHLRFRQRPPRQPRPHQHLHHRPRIQQIHRHRLPPHPRSSHHHRHPTRLPPQPHAHPQHPQNPSRCISRQGGVSSSSTVISRP